VNGHNHVLYSTLLKEARFFSINRLEKWLSKKKYLEAVKIVHLVAETNNLNKLATTVNGNVEIVYHLAWKKVRVYYCPNKKPSYYYLDDCCRRCGNGRAIDSYIDKQELRMVVIQKQTIFDYQLCIQGR
jgi:hypothetical protein